MTYRVHLGYSCNMLINQVWLLVLASAMALALDDKPANQTRIGHTHLGMSLDDPRVINRNAACPPDCPSDCQDLYDQGNIVDGAYIIYVSTDYKRPVVVYCEMESNEGGWTMFQRRINSELDFYRDWLEYVEGFGQVSSEHWLGLQNLHLLLAQKRYRLRVDLVDFNGSTPYAEYAYFTVGPPLSEYSLGVNMFLGGTAGDGLKDQTTPTNHDLTNMKFSTRDQDNDVSVTSCAVSHHGAWWYKVCHKSNLNGFYSTNTTVSNYTFMSWQPWRNGYYSLKSSVMKFRPM